MFYLIVKKFIRMVYQIFAWSTKFAVEIFYSLNLQYNCLMLIVNIISHLLNLTFDVINQNTKTTLHFMQL